MKKMLVALLGLVMVAGAAFATSPTSDSADVKVGNAWQAYIYFIDGGNPVVDNAVSNPYNGGTQNGDFTIWRSNADELTGGLGADGDFDIVLDKNSGNIHTNGLTASDTEYLAHGSNQAGAKWQMQLTDVANTSGDKVGDGNGTDGKGRFYAVIDGMADSDRSLQLVPGGAPTVLPVTPPENTDLVSRFMLVLQDVGVEVKTGTFNGKVNISIVVP